MEEIPEGTTPNKGGYNKHYPYAKIPGFHKQPSVWDIIYNILAYQYYETFESVISRSDSDEKS